MPDLPSVDRQPEAHAMFAAVEGDYELAQQLLCEMPLAQLHQFVSTAGWLAGTAREMHHRHSRAEADAEANLND